MYGISRIDDPFYYTFAWRVSLRRRGKTLVKNFPDKKHGGKGKALKLAKQYRDELVAKHPPITRSEVARKLQKNNKSGVSGVCRFASVYWLADGRQRKTWYWEAIWPTAPGQSETKRFSEKKFGKEGAFAMACHARELGLAKLKGVYWAAERGLLQA
ncbi:hypothetical protein QP938_06570 [Porticoccaceae bacterium LTM1]|nr:hypothetical protein QP938_06570 [Porticoccaceae bacterium LTM1]